MSAAQGKRAGAGDSPARREPWFATRRRLRARNRALEGALRAAMVALRKHDDWCGYNPDAPGDPSFSRAFAYWHSVAGDEIPEPADSQKGAQ